MRRFCLLLLLFALSIGTWAQRTVVSGIVTNSQTGRPIAGANVAVVGGTTTVVTNADGFFTLKFNETANAIRVSHLGFQTSTQHLPANTQQPLSIALKPAVIMLQEIVVTKDNARSIVEAAISKIPDNYSKQPEILEGFYRETAMKRQHFIYIAEGVIDMYKTSYNRSVHQDRVAIRKGRRLMSPRQGDTLGVKVMGGPVQPIQLDIVKNREFLLNNEELDHYHFSFDKQEKIDGRQQFVVRLEPRGEWEYALYHGHLYIDCETLAFTRADLSLDMSDREKATRLMLIRKPSGVRFRPKELSTLIDYRQEGGVTRVSYIRNVFRFNCDWKRRLFATSFAATCEMVVTNRHSNDARPIKGRESFDSRDMFYDKVEYFKDPAFWEDYNIIEPTESLDKAVNRLLKRMK